MDDPAFTEELADGALEWAEALYGTVPPYRDGWAAIHPQDREDWLAGFGDLREPLDQLARWRTAGLLSAGQSDRHETLLAQKRACDPIIAELGIRALDVAPARRGLSAGDYDLL
jgi:hypothetical protein